MDGGVEGRSSVASEWEFVPERGREEERKREWERGGGDGVRIGAEEGERGGDGGGVGTVMGLVEVGFGGVVSRKEFAMARARAVGSAEFGVLSIEMDSMVGETGWE